MVQQVKRTEIPMLGIAHRPLIWKCFTVSLWLYGELKTDSFVVAMEEKYFNNTCLLNQVQGQIEIV